MRSILNCIGRRVGLPLAFAAVVALVGCANPPTKPGSAPVAGVPSGAASAPVVVAPPAPVPKRPPVIGLALGGGAARGFAHIGVIQALEEAGIPVQMVVGTSAGSLVAALYASGKNGKELQALAATMEEGAITDWTIPIFNRGVLRGEALANYVNTNIRHKLIETMPLRLGIVATDLKTGAPALFERGDTGMAVRASSAVPTVFLPVKIGANEYVDGGLVAPVPVAQARAMGAELVIAVDISSPPEGNATDGMVQVLLQTTAIMGKTINQYALREADVVVRPPLVGVKSTDFTAKQRSIDAGKAAMQAQIPMLRRLLESKAVPLRT